MTFTTTLRNDLNSMKSYFKLNLVKVARASTESVSSLLNNIINRTPLFSNIKMSPLIVKKEFIGITKASPPQKRARKNLVAKVKTARK